MYAPLKVALLGAYFSSAMASTLSTLTLPGSPALPLNASHHLHPALHSFSIETAFWTAYMGNVTHPSILTKNLLANLKDRTGTPPQVRVGGITADSTFWNETLDTPLFNFVTEEYVVLVLITGCSDTS